ncbi:MAG: acyl-CoA thioesterase [Phycisphaerae bacterium]|nr:acyl-CoA thioesterase [Phycisphaerae bacterium]
MSTAKHVTRFRVRYSEVDRMGAAYNSRALEWFEAARVELLRAVGLAYDWMEQQGAHLPVVEAHLEYLSRAGFDDELEMTATASMPGKASVRFDIVVADAATGREVVRGYTLHAITDKTGKCLRPPKWLSDALAGDGP